MYSQELKTLGFAGQAPTTLLTRAIASGHVRGLQQVPGFDLIGCFTDPSGARLGLVRRKGHDVQVTPALASPETHRATVQRVRDELAHVSVLLGDDESLELLALVDDPVRYPLRSEGDPNSFTLIQALALGAVVIRADVYADEQDFEQHRPDEDRSWSSRSLASASVAAEGILSGRDLTPRAFATFTVESAWRRTNELTGEAFWYGIGLSRVRLAFAMPATYELEPGNVVAATCTLTASSGLWDQAEQA